jgi:rhodanese-related sulfurtransferase
MAQKRSRRAARHRAVPATQQAATPRTASPSATDIAGRRPIVGLGLALALVVAVVGGFALLNDPLAATATGSADDGQGAAEVQGVGGTWREITVDDLDAMLAAKDFTLLNVKTPYLGEIEGTDLYIPYDQLVARADALPADKDAPLVVYCRTGNQSGTAAQILLDLGYTDIVNVDGGMVAWTASGRELVQLDRS